MKNDIQIEIRVLCAKYVALSEIEECFTKSSKHKAYKKIQSKMLDIIKKIELLKTNKSTWQKKSQN
jgi:hypothetical protein